MSRTLTVAAAQLGPIARNETRTRVVGRMIDLLRQAKARGAGFVVFPELALTTFFPRWGLAEPAEVDTFFEREMPGPETAPLFAAAGELGLGFALGYAELVNDADGRTRHFNTSILVEPDGRISGKYRKIHLPGHREVEDWRPFQHLEKRYFEPGDLGFPVFDTMGGKLGMLICNDRRWPEAFRMLGLQGVELVTIGYNTPQHYPLVPEQDHLQQFHNRLVLQAGAYQNGTWVVGVAKCGVEEGCMLIGESCIVAPTGEVVALCSTLEDEICVAACDLDRCQSIKANIFDFKAHRMPGEYGLLTQR